MSTPERSPSSRANPMDQCLLWSGSSFRGESAGRPLPSLTPRPTGASPHVGESDEDGGRSGVPDLSREGPFYVHQDRPHSGASPRLLDGMQGCQFRMTSYDEEHSRPDFTPAYGRTVHYMTVMGLWRPPTTSEIGDLCHWQRVMPAFRAATASRTCHSEPDGDVELFPVY